MFQFLANVKHGDMSNFIGLITGLLLVETLFQKSRMFFQNLCAHFIEHDIKKRVHGKFNAEMQNPAWGLTDKQLSSKIKLFERVAGRLDKEIGFFNLLFFIVGVLILYFNCSKDIGYYAIFLFFPIVLHGTRLRELHTHITGKLESKLNLYEKIEKDGEKPSLINVENEITHINNKF